MDNENVAANNASVAANNKSVTTNKSQATTCCGSGSNKSVANNNEIGATNLYKYSPYYNKSYVTCCCGCVSIETGTYVAAIVLCVIYVISAILQFLGLFVTQDILSGAFGIVLFFACLLVILAQHARYQWLFLPYLIVGLIELILIGYGIIGYLECSRETLAELKKSSREYVNCTPAVISSVLLILLDVWLYSVILRGLLAIREVDRRRSSPHF